MKDELLSVLGFCEGLIVETLAVTTGSEGVPHPAPLGVHKLSSGLLAVEVFEGGRTYENLERVGEITLNVTTDVELFYRALRGRISSDEYAPSRFVRPPRLKGAEAVVEARVTDGIEKPRSKFFELEVVWIEVFKKSPTGLRRCDFVALESLIHLTRIEALRKGDEVRELLSLIRSYDVYAKRRCPWRPYREIINFVLREVERLVEEVPSQGPS